MSQPESEKGSDAIARDNVRGILWAFVATGLFALVAAMAKIAVAEYHVLQILFFRQIVVFLSSLPSIASHFPESLRTRHIGLHGVRLIGAFVALSCGIWSVAVLPLTTAITLAFAQVFFVVLLAGRFLGETVGPFRLATVLAGFVGVVVVLQPGTDGFVSFHALIPLAGAFGAALAVIAVRELSQTESTATLLVYQSVFVGVLAGVPMLWLWETPDLAGFSLLASMGVLSAFGQWAGIRALRYAEASVIGGIQYTQVVYAAFLGYAIFGEVPARTTLIGAATIIAAALFILHRERLAKSAT